ncbi:transposase domain-containing protein [Streptomyces sp. NPDC019890]|uniref:transposase domain-containing protein n=1 Tax=Streptomyces sp. NPDC019890 TaxID=3365064 RepID=UPI00384F6B36
MTWVYPPGLVDRVVAACGRVEQRRRLLPARLVVYFVLRLALFSPLPIWKCCGTW